MIVNKFSFFSKKSNKVIFTIFTIFTLLSMFADFIANDKPIIVKCNNKYYWPIFKIYPETEFGGFLKTKTDYRDSDVILYIKKYGWAIWPPVHFSYKTINYNIDSELPSPPNSENILGTDEYGRDVFAQILYGYRVSFLFGVLSAAIILFIGITMGLVQGYLGGTTDILLQRFTEVWASLPFFLIVIAISYVMRPNFLLLLLIVSFMGWTRVAGMMRFDVLRIRNMEYVLFARSLGVGTGKIILRHIMPNALGSVLSYAPFLVAEGLVKLTALDFIGFGIGYNIPSLGRVLEQAKNNISAPWIVISSFLVLAYVLIMLVFIGKHLRSFFRRRSGRI